MTILINIRYKQRINNGIYNVELVTSFSGTGNSDELPPILGTADMVPIHTTLLPLLILILDTLIYYHLLYT